MEITDVATPLPELDVDALIVLFPQGASDAGPFVSLDEACAGLLSETLQGTPFRGMPDKPLAAPTRGAAPFADLIVGGWGKPQDADLDSWREGVAAAARLARERRRTRIAVAIPRRSDLATAPQLAAAATEAVRLAEYRFAEFKTPKEDEPGLEWVGIAAGSTDVAAEVSRADTIAQAVCWARDLINTSPSDKRPPRFAEIAAEMAAASGLTCEVLDERAATGLGLNALLAVARGSSAEPRLVVLEHRPAGTAEQPPVLLVGKGVTFDTGGISIKPARSMDEMKADMSGAAAVLATMRAVADLALPLRVAAVVPMAENMPDGDSYRPGDLVRAYGGTTIEVLNTDAEGRLILADALAYGCERFQPRCVVDLATLTGACVVALGESVAGLMDNDQSLAAEILAAGEATAEPVWRLPMLPHYRKLIESRVADIKNTGGRWAGAITAAKFLQEFVGDTPWVHLDIAGPAYATKGSAYRPRGGTGFAVRLLVHWLTGRTGA